MTRTRSHHHSNAPFPTLLALALGLGACAPVGTANGRTAGPGDASTTGEPGQEAELVPAGYGTLRQDDFTLSIRDGDLLIKVTPLDESVIRLAAPDTYARLRATAESRMERARAAVYSGEPELMLVSFFSYSPDVEYRPDDVQLMQQGRLMRPVEILPVTSGWGRGRLQQREIQNAVYVFDQSIEYDQPMTARYSHQTSGDWMGVVSTLERERARVRTSAGN